MGWKNDKQGILAKYIYQNDLNITFHPQNSNFKHAIAMTNSMIKNLKKKNQLNMFKEDIDKKIQLGTLEKLIKEELAEILRKTHHFCYVSMVQSKNSETCQARMINNPKDQDFSSYSWYFLLS